jgi:glycosyltransferase involved in cell wall biosynthesis
MTDISVVVPLYNEEGSLAELSEWIDRVMNYNDYSYELILVDDGSNDRSWRIIEELSAANNRIRGIKFRRNYGKSAALQTGFEAACGDVVITMDADLQDSPDEIPALYRMITLDGYHLVSGWKKKRHDPFSKTVPSRFFNWVTQKMSGIHNLHDFNCGLKAYRKDVVKTIEVYGEMHRYIPVIAKWAGYGKIGEKIVEHRARKYGRTKFGMERFINGFLDLMSIMFVSRFGKKPMHLFGSLGTLLFLLGFFFAAFLGLSKLYMVANHIEARPLTDRPSFYISLTCMIMGTQMFMTGFVSELVSRNSQERNSYLIEKKINIP